MTDAGFPGDPSDAPAPVVPRSVYPPGFDTTSLAMAVLGGDGAIQDVTTAFAREVGIDRADLIGLRLRDLWRFTEADERAVEEAFARSGLHLVDVVSARPEVADVQLQLMPVADEGARVGTIVRAITDETRRGGQERTLAREGFELSFEQFEVGMLMTGLDGYITRSNPAMQRMLALTAEELGANDAFAIIHPDHHVFAVELGWRLLSGEADSYSQETRLLRADGSAVWVHESTTCVRDDHGDALHFTSQFIDIDDRKRAEAERDRALADLTQALDALRESESKFKFLVHGIPVPLVELDRDYRICSANAALAELLGCDPIGLLVHDIVLDADVQSASRQFWNDELGEDSVMDVRIRRADGTARWVRSHARIHRDDDGAFLLATATWTDITESRQEDAELRRQASTDPLTGLANRSTLFARLEASIAAAEHPGSVAVLFVDLDHFKPINDRWGHEAGDELLAVVADRLRGCVRQRDLVGRIGGDEFVIVVDAERGDAERGDRGGAEQLGQRIVDVVGQPFELSFGTATIGASVGLAYGGADSDPRQLVRQADMAAYDAKSAGRARLVVSSS